MSRVLQHIDVPFLNQTLVIHSTNSGFLVLQEGVGFCWFLFVLKNHENIGVVLIGQMKSSIQEHRTEKKSQPKAKVSFILESSQLKLFLL